MSGQLPLEEKRRLAEKVLGESLEKKRLVEMSIRRQLDELKSLEVSLEKIRAGLQSDAQRPVAATAVATEAES